MADPRKSVFDDENITEAEVVDNTKNSTTSTEQQTIQQATQDTTTQDKQAILEDNSNEGANYNPMAGDVKKSKVYVKNDKGNVVKVNFGDKKMRIKKSIPARRKSFRARHNCANPGPRWKARYWSCRAW